MSTAGRATQQIAGFFATYWRSFAAAVAAGLFLALVGAFGSGTASLSSRIVLWVPMLLFGTLVGDLIGIRMRRRPRIGENPWAVWAIVTLMVTGVVTIFAWGYTRLLFGAAFSPGPLFYLGAVAIVAGPVTAIMMLINRPGLATHAAPPSNPSARVAVRFLHRIPEKLKGGVLYAVQAEDHYLRLHTSKGSDLILFRLADAIGELAGIEGAQTHRSWWVAKDAIAEVKRDRGRVVLSLKDATQVPVSRANAKALRDSGWI
jgi:DNA-binding LytR/AlgR family response regulator